MDDDDKEKKKPSSILETDELSSALRADLPPGDEKGKTDSALSKSKEAVPLYDRWSVRDDGGVDYGYFGPAAGKGRGGSASSSSVDDAPPPKEEKKKGFYITTAINYTNGPAHMGHAYEAATADALARYARLKEGRRPAWFVTGTDEHGEKIVKTAANEGKDPIDLCDKYVTGFQCLNQRILVSNDDYVRTTSDRHKRTAKELWRRCASNGDVYLDAYSGWYNVKEETFVTDSEAELAGFKDPTTGQPLKRVEEESYFFRMSKYHDILVQHIQDHPEFVRPESQRKFILSRLESDRLRDLSVSRTSFEWGIPVPEGFDDRHVMYVWFDALSNYLTGVDGLGVNDPEANSPADNVKSDTRLANMWPADVHVIGKDILWFHAVIWPCILTSAKIPLPKTIFAHGFVNDKEGKKMSKSVGNVVDPHDMLDRYSVDTFRWYLCKEAPYGGELSFSEDSLRDMHNADLCDTVGNLVHRATNLCKKYCDGIVPDVPPPSEGPAIDFDSIRTTYVSKMDDFELEGGANVVAQAYRDLNGYLTERAPWLMKGEDAAQERKIVVRATLEAVYALSHLLLPFVPDGGSQIFRKLRTDPTHLSDVRGDLRNLAVGTEIDVGDVLYAKILSDEELSAAEAAKKKAASYADAQKRKKEKKAKAAASSKAGQKQSDGGGGPTFAWMDVRVGRITKVWHHPDADKLFCEEIDVGDDGGPRQIASGLRGHYALEELQGKQVLVVCNLKAAKIVGFQSNGMVLAAKSEDGATVELVLPLEGSTVGERIFVDGMDDATAEPLSAGQVKKRKAWDKIAKGLKTGEGGTATWEGKQLRTSAGPCSVASLVGAPIS